MRPTDKATEKDELGFKPYVKGVARLIRDIDTEDLPLATGIYGSWGSGKTSFMLQLKDMLEKPSEESDSPLPTVWVDVWKYESIHDVRSALINKILSKLEKKVSDGDKKKHIQEHMKKVRQILVEMFMHSRLTIGIPGAHMSLPSLKEATKFADGLRCL